MDNNNYYYNYCSPQLATTVVENSKLTFLTRNSNKEAMLTHLESSHIHREVYVNFSHFTHIL